MECRVTEIARRTNPFGRDSALAIGAMTASANRPEGLLRTPCRLLRRGPAALAALCDSQKYEPPCPAQSEACRRGLSLGHLRATVDQSPASRRRKRKVSQKPRLSQRR